MQPRDAHTAKHRRPGALQQEGIPTMADNAAKGKSPTWPNGEPKSVRDAYDAQQSGKSGRK
ncbi:hypothetical protein GCM10022214_10790 [Actinomadura miaoliensis]|uniref:Uncharacterized protein n=1 Tax=Actinomadura miaoliensis TaxID=430685 RepID=A0ABP7V7L6_9ACTN